MNNIKTNEINIIGLINKVLKEKKTMLVFMTFSLVLGIGYAIGQQKRYTAFVTIAPEANSMGMSQSLSDIAGVIGVDLGSSNTGIDAIYPEIYPNIFASKDFVIKLFNIPVVYKGEKKTYYNHILKDEKTPYYKIPYKYLISLFKNKDDEHKNYLKLNSFQLTKEQDAVCNSIISKIDCQMDKGSSIINISAEDVDPYIAACIADTLQHRLQDYITQYRTQKARLDYTNAVKLNKDAQAKYEKLRKKYTSFADANTDVLLKSYQVTLEDMENDLQLKYNNYASTQQQVQKALDKIQEKTPAFTIIQGASVPLKASNVPRTIIVLISIIIGAMIDIIWVLGIKDNIKKIKL